jgi:hypothetical protein
VLLVSGSIKTNEWNAAVALQKLTKDSAESKHKVAVAYNPFFPDQKDRDQERRTLETKFQTGKVSKVYLQFGTNLEVLEEALKYLSSPSKDSKPEMFLPTKVLIAQQKFRPWKGVFLSDEFLSGPDGARQVIVDILRLYKKYDVELLFEAPGIRNDKDMEMVESLLGERDSGVSQPHTEKETSNSEPLPLVLGRPLQTRNQGPMEKPIAQGSEEIQQSAKIQKSNNRRPSPISQAMLYCRHRPLFYLGRTMFVGMTIMLYIWLLDTHQCSPSFCGTVPSRNGASVEHSKSS